MSNQRTDPNFTAKATGESTVMIDVDYDWGRPESFRGIKVFVYADGRKQSEETFTDYTEADQYVLEQAEGRECFELSGLRQFLADGGTLPRKQ